MAGSPDDGIDAATAREMVRCGVNQVDSDHLVPEDGRLEAVLWSWAEDEPATPGCAEHTEDARFRSRDCAEPQLFVCAVASGWAVTTTAGPWSAGAETCRLQFGDGATFATPRNGLQNELVREAKLSAGVASAWLAYAAVDGVWTTS